MNIEIYKYISRRILIIIMPELSKLNNKMEISKFGNRLNIIKIYKQPKNILRSLNYN